MRFFKFLVFSIFLASGTTVFAQDSLNVTFRFYSSDNAIRSYVPGEFNNWGNNQSGKIPNADGSLLTQDTEFGFSYQIIRLRVGGGNATFGGNNGYAYKFHEQYNASGTAWDWFSDPLNTATVGPNSDSFIRITHPLIFQVKPSQNSAALNDLPAITANIAAKDDDPIDVTASQIIINGNIAGTFEGFYETARQLLHVPSIAELGVTLNNGSNTLEIIAVTEAAVTRSQLVTFSFIPAPDVVEQARPVGLEDGVTLYPDEPGKVSFSLYAPGKQYVYVYGDHSDWEISDNFLMKMDAPRADSVHFWITLEGLETGTYRFQYLVDGQIRVTDPFAELVLDPSLDQYISSSVYPNMPQYPTGLTTEVVGVFEMNRTPYVWQVPDFQRPEPEELVIYELLLRDFVTESTFSVLRDTLGYLENLGINAIELMPVSNFDGNLSWGYNPNFHGALDKSYGTRESFKQFVDEAHSRGIAVILDVVYNHTQEKSPLIRLFGTNQATNPLIGPGHAYNVITHLNHDHPYIQYWVDRMNKYWLQTYNIDGYRFDLSKGFASNVNISGNLDGNNPQRIANLKRMYDKIREYDQDAYVILEHFAANSEEIELSNYGMMLWGNLHHNFSEGTMGFNNSGASDFSSIYFKNRNWTKPHLVGYMESHDEQWQMRRMKLFGNNSNPEHNTRQLEVALNRMKLAGAFFFTIPGPKMMWQFGELGYGWGNQECLKPGDGTNGNCLGSDPGRTGQKPVRWQYYEDPFRNQLYRTWAALIKLRHSHPAFSSAETQFSSFLSGNAKWIKLQHPDMDAVIIGNFDVIERDRTITFTQTGTWYDYFSGQSIEISSLDQQTFTLAPGEFKIFTTQFFETPDQDLFTSNEDEQVTSDLPSRFNLYQNYPNPFNPSTLLRYDVPEMGMVRLEVYDMLGRKVSTLVDNSRHQAGTFTVSFDASDLSSGIYFARFVSSDMVLTRKMTLIK